MPGPNAQLTQAGICKKCLVIPLPKLATGAQMR